MDLLPEDVIGEVLRRVPGRSLAASRGVCRAWRAVMDDLNLLLPHMLPHSVCGIFTNYRGSSRPRFFGRPCSPGTIDAAFDFITTVQRGTNGRKKIVDHCNGLLLYDGCWYWTHLHVCNPATRRWALVPPVPGRHRYPGLVFAGAYLAFDPAVSLHYEVLLVPDVPHRTTDDDEEDPEGLMDWPPSCHRLLVFSSSTGRWEERALVRVGKAAGTIEEMRSHMEDQIRNFKMEYSYAEYWRGALYVHCRAGAFVSRFCTSEHNYQVIKAPTSMEENKCMQSNFGRSEKGIYYSSFADLILRVWILLEESHDPPEWVLMYDVDLNPLSYRMNTLYSEEINRSWTVDDDVDSEEQENPASAEWNSDNDDVLEYKCSQEQQSGWGFYFLGFHPYKEVVFLSHTNYDVVEPCIYNAVACHLGSLKAQYLGRNRPNDFGHWQIEEGSFMYTPCLLDLLPRRE